MTVQYSEEQVKTTLRAFVEYKTLDIIEENVSPAKLVKMRSQIVVMLDSVFEQLPFYLGEDFRPKLKELLGDKYVE